tara:strand:- start:1259 stop:2242 length:984 start_codon:yes stop_codon:yes gene_type:complete
MKKIVGINGFGRFAHHLLKYWISNPESKFDIKYINDEYLSLNKALDILRNDEKIEFKGYSIESKGNVITFNKNESNEAYKIIYTNFQLTNIEWLGLPDLVFECSGKYTNAKECEIYLKSNTKKVLISATSLNADQTSIYGFNSKQILAESKILSYGSCTVNAFVPLANYVNNKYEVLNSDVNVVHNIQAYKLDNFKDIKRHPCTLQISGPNLLNFLNDDNFMVNYTLIPFAGISSMDFRFATKKKIDLENFINDLANEINNGSLKNLYGFNVNEGKPSDYLMTPKNLELIKKNIKLKHDNIYLQGYFDNENSGTRFFDIANLLCDII